MLTDLQKAKLHKHLNVCLSGLVRGGSSMYENVEESDKEKLKESYSHFIGRIEMGMEIGVDEVMGLHDFIKSVVDTRAYAATGIRVALEQSEGLKLIPAIYIRLRSKLGPNDDMTRTLLEAHFKDALESNMTVQEEADKIKRALSELGDLLDDSEKSVIEAIIAPLKTDNGGTQTSISVDPLA